MKTMPTALRPPEHLVGGVLVRLARDARLRAAAVARLQEDSRITLGERTGRWLTLAVEAARASEGRELHAWLATVPGVEWVEVVSVLFDFDSVDGAATGREAVSFAEDSE